MTKSRMAASVGLALALAGACSVDDEGYQFGAGGSESGGTGSARGGGGNAGDASTSGGMTQAGAGGGGGETTGGSGGSGGDGSLGRGDPCRQNGDCMSAYCVDGVCCDKRCDGLCEACISDKTGEADGTCAGVSSGSDPDRECAADTDVCGQDGSCDGAGACLLAAPSVECAPEKCSGGRYTPPSHCDGSGACVAPDSVACSQCVGTGCEIACTTADECPTGFYCDGSRCVATKGNGQACDDSSECADGACASGVCCDSACDGICASCLQMDTGEPDGTCAPVKAGTPHGADCTASAASSCGLDGKCDGAGACRYHVSGTECAAAACPAGTSTKSAARTCDGGGTCSTAMTASCGVYLCDAMAAACQTSCTPATAATACKSSAYCATNRCTAKKAAGAVCGADVECASGDCAGRCCNAGTACSCVQPSAANLLKNPGFDADLSGWTQDPGSGGFSWQSSATDASDQPGDAAACPFSGSAYVAQTGASQRIWQCVAVQPLTDYNFGVRMHTSLPVIDYAYCGVEFYPGANCTGSAPAGSETAWLNVPWSAPQTLQVNSSAGASAKVYCYGDGTFYFDYMYLSRAPATY